jgi:hypothetical protein
MNADGGKLGRIRAILLTRNRDAARRKERTRQALENSPPSAISWE